MKPINGLLAIGGLRRLVTACFQDQTDGFANVRIIVYDQDHRGEPPRPGSRAQPGSQRTDNVG
jgi:hypothetical protein